MRYKIPQSALDTFIEVARSNKSEIDHLHIETLAYFVGYEDPNGDVITTEVVFPNQVGTASSVIDEGKN